MVLRNARKSFHDSGGRDRITSPVEGSRRTKPSGPSNRYSEGKRTAWLRPLRNSLAIRGMVYIMIYTNGHVNRKCQFPLSVCDRMVTAVMTTPRKLVYLSHTVAHGLITYKGLPAPIICHYLTREASPKHYAPGTAFQIGKVEMVANTRTSLHSPFH